MATIYTSLYDVPLDTPVPDGKDKPDDQKRNKLPENFDLSTKAPNPNFVIPFIEVIKEGTTGSFVKGAKRALYRANNLKLPSFTPVFGPIAVSQLKKFQKREGLTPDGQIGINTLKKLAPHFDAYAFLLYAGYAPGNKEAAERQKIVAYGTWGYNNRGSVHYAEIRPMDYIDNLLHLPVVDDCSEFATKAYKYANVKDPNGLNYNGNGWTGTLAVHGNLVSLAQAKAGDLVLYGPRPDFSHVTIYIGNGRVISEGSEAGPLLLDIDYRNDRAEIRSYL